MEYNAVQSVKSQLAFRREISLLSAGSKNTSSKKSGSSACGLLAGSLLGLFFDFEDGDDVPLKRLLTLNGLYKVISYQR
jgi:hypothetical protein